MKIKLFIIVAGLFLSLLIVPGIIYAQSWCHTFNTNLGTGESGSIEVAYLHVALLAQNISYGNDGLTDYSTGTIAGVTAFQERYASEILAPWGLTHGTGYTGTTTRAKLNQLYGCSTTPSGCTEQWQCTGWGSCYNGSQTQTCTDYNFCGTTVNKPATSRSCSSSTNTNNTNTCQATCITQLDGVYAISCSGSPTKCSSNQTCEQTFSTSYDYSSGYVQTTQTLTGAHCTYSSSNNNNSNNTNNTCTTDWDCGSWSACVNKQQTKTCTDSNNCGTTANKPSETQTCTTNQPSITVTSPNGGQTWQMGQTYTISWSAVGMSAQDTVNVMLYSASSGNTGGYMIANITPVNNGLYVWNIPSTIIGVLRPDNKFIIGVASTADPTNEDISDNYFTIAAAGDYCFQLYSKIDASYHKDCGETGYDPVADIDKNGRVSSGDETLYDAHKTDQTWCQQRLSETTSPCTTAYQSQLDFISNSVASIYQQLKYLLGQ